jgi:broad specificity phosphatase PhoE
MRYIIFVRHGIYSLRFEKTSDGKKEKKEMLTEDGRRKIIQLLEKLAPFLDRPSSMKCFSSPEPRAKESADIICKALQIDFEETKLLWDGSISPKQEQEMLTLIERCDSCSYSVVIMVTHQEWAEHSPKVFFGFEEEEGKRIFVNPGQAMVLDCGQRTFEIV